MLRYNFEGKLKKKPKNKDIKGSPALMKTLHG